jgi:hypothetical protein
MKSEGTEGQAGREAVDLCAESWHRIGGRAYRPSRLATHTCAPRLCQCCGARVVATFDLKPNVDL